MKWVISVIIVLILASCSNGKIQIDEQTAYHCPSGEMHVLINTSSSKKITFTVKSTYLGHDKTDKYTLNPGEQGNLGCYSEPDKAEVTGEYEEK